MIEVREIRIVGGGLAGLSLGIGLRRHGIPVTLYEAGSYPRHKVCGEFIAGLSREILDTLGIADDLADAKRHESVAWLRDGRVFRRDRLPAPAFGISRHALDLRLSERFVGAGGTLLTGRRMKDDGDEGVVWSAGRQRGRGAWIGLKAHCSGLQLSADLELHLGEQAYVGASSVESGRVNVCGLFRNRAVALSAGDPPLLAYLRAAKLDSLAERLRAANLDTASARSVAALRFGATTFAQGRLRIGDAYALIPPFTGDGMAMAFEGAALAVDPIRGYATGRLGWREACEATRRALDERFRVRLAAARALHPLIFRPPGQAAFRMVSSVGVIPFSSIYQLLHN